MKQTIYCNCFYCEHYEDGKCISPVLHLGNHSFCKEFSASEEKMNAYLDTHSPIGPIEYGELEPEPCVLRLR